MNPNDFHWISLLPALPEIYVTGAICLLLLVDVFFGHLHRPPGVCDQPHRPQFLSLARLAARPGPRPSRMAVGAGPRRKLEITPAPGDFHGRGHRVLVSSRRSVAARSGRAVVEPDLLAVGRGDAVGGAGRAGHRAWQSCGLGVKGKKSPTRLVSQLSC